MRTFFPKQRVMVDASSHSSGTHYSVGVGSEMWSDDPVRVVKVQMSYNGQVAGRKAPSFPVTEEKRGKTTYNSCPDFDAVVMAVEKCISPLRTWMITWDRPTNGPDVSNKVIDAIKSLYTVDVEDLEMPCIGIRTIDLEGGQSASDVADSILGELRKIGAPKDTKIFVGRLADHAAGKL